LLFFLFFPLTLVPLFLIPMLLFLVHLLVHVTVIFSIHLLPCHRRRVEPMLLLGGGLFVFLLFLLFLLFNLILEILVEV
jgi:hypothetical protein